MQVNMNPAMNAVSNATAKLARNSQDYPEFASLNMQMARAAQMKSQDSVSFGHKMASNGNNDALINAATTSSAAVGAAAATAGSVWAFTSGASSFLGAVGAPIAGVALAAVGGLLSLFTVSNFFGGNK